MNSSRRCHNCDKRAWLEQNLYTGQLSGQWQGRKSIKEVHALNEHQIYFKANFAGSYALRTWCKLRVNPGHVKLFLSYSFCVLFLSIFLFFSFQFTFFFKGYVSYAQRKTHLWECRGEILSKHRTKPDKSGRSTDLHDTIRLLLVSFWMGRL